jgi:cytochrome d ubiquinol oxidase subunit I
LKALPFLPGAQSGHEYPRSPSLTGFDVALSLSLYILVYLIMFPPGIAFMAAIVRRGVAGATEPPPAIAAGNGH